MLQFNQLLEPISPDSPAGEDITFSVEVDAINKARQFDDPTLDQGEWVTDVKEADWDFVFDKCLSLLGNKTKDLRISAWLIESAAKTRQFEGMAAGFELLSSLCERYWDVIHPLMEGQDTEQRVGNIAWLVTRSVQLVKEIPLTEGRGTQYSWTDFEAARTRANNAAKAGETTAEPDGQPTMAMLESARRKSSKAFYETLIGTAVHCQKMLKELEQTLDTRLGNAGPSFTPLKESLETVINTAQRYGADVGLKSTTTDKTESAVDDAALAAVAQNSTHAIAGPIKNRDQALEQLRKVAEFFRSTEPHSPVAYLADKAATWGDLPLHTWLKTVVKDPGSLAFIEEMLGVKSVEHKEPE
jgi:type VI secretion system protein ImpA